MMCRKKKYIMLCLVIGYTINACAQDTLAFQGFSQEIFNNWQYVANPEPYNVSDDIWDTVVELGAILPASEPLFWGMQDLDNANGGGSFFHELSFNSLSLEGYTNNQFSFNYNVVSFDTGDKITLTLLINQFYPLEIPIFTGASGGASTEGWETYSLNLPDSVSRIGVTLHAKQNGGTDQAGFDNLIISGFPAGSIPLNADFLIDSNPVFHGDTAWFIDNTSGGEPPYIYAWDFQFDGIIDDTVKNPGYKYTLPGVYPVVLYVEDQAGTTDTIINTPGITVLEQPKAWINEFHYDDNSKDTNETVEIIIKNAPDYTLSDFTISLYNGSNGAVYNSTTVDLGFPGDTTFDYYFYSIPFPSLQNGSPDGIAIDCGGRLLNFISYEGDFVGTSGPAAGILSEEVGQQETSSTPVGYSLQLQGCGTSQEHFFWQESQPASLGSLNPGQFLNPPLTTEWMGDSSSMWYDNNNWSTGLPGPETNILMEAGKPFYPVLTQKAFSNRIVLKDGAYLLDSANQLSVNNIQVEKILTGGIYSDDPENAVYHFISSPVAEAKAISVFPGDAFVRYYDETQQLWININGEDRLTPGRGYSVFLPSGNNLAVFSDSTINGNITFSGLSISGNLTAYSGFHLLGNPFLAPIDWDLVQRNNIAQTVYVWYNGDYLEWNGSVGSLTGGILPVAQGFFVQAIATDNQIIINKTAQIATHASLLKKHEDTPFTLEVALHYNNLEDNCYLAFYDAATIFYDPQFDALKLSGQNFHPEIYFQQNEINYAINYTPFDPEAEYPIGLHLPEEGDYLLQLKGDDFISTHTLYLIDFITNTTYNTEEIREIIFHGHPDDNPFRFALMHSETGIQDLDRSYFNTKILGRTLSITGNKGDYLCIHTIEGRCIGTWKIITDNTTVTQRLTPGIYIITWRNESTKIQKIIIH